MKEKKGIPAKKKELEATEQNNQIVDSSCQEKEQNKKPQTDHSICCSEIQRLQDELSKKNQAILDLTHTAQYVQADFENYKKRVEREKEAFSKQAGGAVIKEILPLLDHFELALKHKGSTEEFNKGIELIFAEFMNMLETQGIRQIDCSGSFNPEFHEVLLTEKSERPDGTILEEIQKGYLLYGKVLRPAKVKVAKS